MMTKWWPPIWPQLGVPRLPLSAAAVGSAGILQRAWQEADGRRTHRAGGLHKARRNFSWPPLRFLAWASGLNPRK